MTSPASHAARGQFPQFLYALTIGLRIQIAIELEALHELLGERTARAFGEDHHPGLEIVSRLEVRFLLVLLVHAFVVGANSGDAASFEKQLRPGESSKDGDASFLHFATEPLHKAIERDDVVAVIAQGRRGDGKLEFVFLRKKVDRFPV